MTTASDLSAWTRTIQIKERDGILFATSEEEPTFFVSAPSTDVLFGIVECALADLFRDVYKRDVSVLWRKRRKKLAGVRLSSVNG